MGLTLDYMIQISKVLKVPLLALADDDYENRLSEEVAAAPAVSKCIAAGKLEIPLRSDTSVCVTGLPLDLTDDEANRLANVIVAFANGGISSREKNG